VVRATSPVSCTYSSAMHYRASDGAHHVTRVLYLLLRNALERLMVPVPCKVWYELRA
jgi:hypothetical protein